MPYKYETKNCKNCIYCAKTVNGLYCLHREGQPKITNGGWCIDCQEKVRRINIKNLDQYYFDRDSFVECFKSVFSDDEIFELESACQEHKLLGDFLLYYVYDEFYIIHLTSGIMINWYKHLGRANTCNKKGFTLNDLKELLQMLKSEGEEE